MAADYSEIYRNHFAEQLKQSGQFSEEDLSQMDIPAEILGIMNDELLIRYHALPIRMEGSRVVCCTDTEQTFKNKSSLEEALGKKVKLIYTSEDNLKLGALKFYGISSFQQSSGQYLQNIETDMTPLKGAINTMLQDAARRKASDIHLLPQFTGYRVVFRINGHAYDMTSNYTFSDSQMTNVASLIKQMDTSQSADMTKTNMPNEGSFYMTHGGQDIFVRLETLPEGNGVDRLETIILRLQPQAGRSNTARKRKLEDIGYTDEDLNDIKQVLYRNPTGLCIISGPTGSGKTTSLHAAIHYVLEARQEPLNVIEIAEPIEIYEDEFTQIQIHKAENEGNNLSGEKILEAVLRSDPDIILFNEIRNATDATVATQASNTGHLVFSTVHAGDCIGTILRLLDLDISRTTLLLETKVIMAQRLVATLCPHCRQPHVLTPDEKKLLTGSEILRCEGRVFEKADTVTAASCQYCNNGLSGRTAVVEYVILNTEIRDALLRNNDFRTINQVLLKNGFRSMWSKGMDMAIEGKIAISDLITTVGREEKQQDDFAKKS